MLMINLICNIQNDVYNYVIYNILHVFLPILFT